MVQIGVEVVHSNSIDTQTLQQNSIAETDRPVAERINA